MLHLFQASVQKLCKTTDNILLAVSGGLDSMVMVRLFQLSGYRIGVAHCNFQLRSIESDGDENFVKEKCKEWSIPFHNIRFDTNNYAAKNGLSTQMAARTLRYEWFQKLLVSEGYNYIATAHHLNDSIETVLLNLTRGTGLEGLTGIPSKNENVIRPLLFAIQQDIIEFAAKEEISWREDLSNQSDHYQRNFFRHQIIPKLRVLNPSLERTFQETLQKIQGAEEIVSTSLKQWKIKYRKLENNKTLFDKKGFSEGSLEYRTTILWELIKHEGFNFSQCRDVIQGLDGQSGKRFLSNTHELIIDRSHLMISQTFSWLEAVSIDADQEQAKLAQWNLIITSKGPSEISQNASIASIDADLLQFPLRWRKWSEGDYFFPLGMKHRKKLSDFMIDEKISLIDKDTITIIESQGAIVWVVGHRIDDRFKVTSRTKKILQFEVA